MDMAHCADAIAQLRRALEIHLLGRFVHLLGELILNEPALSGEELFRLRDQRRVMLLIDAAYARRAAALDLIEQTRPRAALEDRVRTRAQKECALQRVEGHVHRGRGGERSEIDSVARLRATMLE